MWPMEEYSSCQCQINEKFKVNAVYLRTEIHHEYRIGIEVGTGNFTEAEQAYEQLGNWRRDL
jgi:hypothetical protein